MACPTCGSSARRPIAPGYWECRGAVTVGVQGAMPLETACRTRYQEGQGEMRLGLCHCNTGAIGLCSRCESPVCGDHSSLAGESRVCGSCRQAELLEWEKHQRRHLANVAEQAATLHREKSERVLASVSSQVPSAFAALAARKTPAYRMVRTSRKSPSWDAYEYVTEWLDEWWVLVEAKKDFPWRSDRDEGGTRRLAILLCKRTGELAWKGPPRLEHIRYRRFAPKWDGLLTPHVGLVDLSPSTALDEHHLQALLELDAALPEYISGTRQPIALSQPPPPMKRAPK